MVETTKNDNVTQVHDWQRPGFHRPLAGLLFNLLYMILAAGFGILLTIWFIPNIVYPFPEGTGYENVAVQLFAIWFTIFDLGIGAAISRFVGEENITNPRQAIQYIQFFIWFQMISGLLQVTIIAIWVLQFLGTSDLAYASWFFLIYSTIQYPGCLGIFRQTLEAYQRFDKSTMLSVLQTQVFENLCRILCILIGRYLGSLNPEFGELAGAVIGSLIGRYMKEFVTAALAAHWVKPVLKEIDPSYELKHLFFVQFDKTVIKKCTSFGLQVLLPGLISPLANFIVIAIMLEYMPNYSTLYGIYLNGETIASLVQTFQFRGISSTFSESFLHKKFKLANYYLHQFYRWTAVLGLFMTGLLYSGSILIGIIMGARFALVVPVIQHLVFWKIMYMEGANVDSVLTGIGKPQFSIVLSVAENFVRIFLIWFLLVVYPVGLMALIYSTAIGWLIKVIIGHAVITRSLKGFKLNVWQTIIAPGIAALVEAGYIYLLTTFALPAMAAVLPRVLSAIILMIIGVFTGPFLIYFPALSLVGGWDDSSLKILDKAKNLSGPSKPIISFITNVSLKLAKITPLHNKFGTDDSGVEEEINELMGTWKENRSKAE